MKIYQFSEKGRRNSNEDNIFPNPADEYLSSEGGLNDSVENLYLVCDGMGGHQRGEIASDYICTQLPKYFKDNNITISDEKIVKNAIKFVESKIDAYLVKNVEASGMGSTLCMLHLHKKGATIAHVGDSRCYQIRDGKIIFQTKDHSLVQKMVDQGLIETHEMRTHENKNIILEAIQGASVKTANPSINIITDLKENDLFFLCTDGVIEVFDDEQLATLFSNLPSLEAVTAKIVRKCSEESNDNFSGYIIQLSKLFIEQLELIPEPSAQSMGNFTVLNATLENLENPSISNNENMKDNLSIIEIEKPAPANSESIEIKKDVEPSTIQDDNTDKVCNNSIVPVEEEIEEEKIINQLDVPIGTETLTQNEAVKIPIEHEEHIIANHRNASNGIDFSIQGEQNIIENEELSKSIIRPNSDIESSKELLISIEEKYRSSDKIEQYSPKANYKSIYSEDAEIETKKSKKNLVLVIAFIGISLIGLLAYTFFTKKQSIVVETRAPVKIEVLKDSKTINPNSNESSVIINSSSDENANNVHDVDPAKIPTSVSVKKQENTRALEETNKIKEKQRLPQVTQEDENVKKQLEMVRDKIGRELYDEAKDILNQININNIKNQAIITDYNLLKNKLNKLP